MTTPDDCLRVALDKLEEADDPRAALVRALLVEGSYEDQVQAIGKVLAVDACQVEVILFSLDDEGTRRMESSLFCLRGDTMTRHEFHPTARHIEGVAVRAI